MVSFADIQVLAGSQGLNLVVYVLLCSLLWYFCILFAMAKIRRIGHDHQAPFWHVLDVSSGDAKRKQAATCTIHLGPPIFLQILDPL